MSENFGLLLHYLDFRNKDFKIDADIKQIMKSNNTSIEKLYKDGYLVYDDHTGFLYDSTMPQLKDILKSLDMSTSGKKEELIQRIIYNTTESQRENISNKTYYILSPLAKEIADKYFNDQKLKRDMKIRDIISSIHENKMIEACLIYKETDNVISDEHSIESAQKHIDHIRQISFDDITNDIDYKKALYRALILNSFFNMLGEAIMEFVPLDIHLECKKLDTFLPEKYITEYQKVYIYLRDKALRNNKIPQEYPWYISPAELSGFIASTQFNILFDKNIEGFPKTYTTFKKHFDANSEKYKEWSNYL